MSPNPVYGVGGLSTPWVEAGDIPAGNPRGAQDAARETRGATHSPAGEGHRGHPHEPRLPGFRVEGVAPKVFPCFPVSIRFRGMGGDVCAYARGEIRIPAPPSRHPL